MRSVINIFSFDLVSKILLGGAGIALIRYMPEGEYATYTLCISIVAMVSQFLTGSFDRIYVVGYDKFDIQKNISTFLGLELLLVCFLFGLGYSLFPSLQGMYGVLFFLAVATCLFQFSKVIFQRGLEFKKISMVELSRTGIFIIGVFVLIFVLRYQVRATYVMSVQVFGLTVVALPILIQKIEFGKLLCIGDGLRLGRKIIIGKYRYLIAFVVLSSLFPQLNVFMLSFMSDSHSVASYGSAYRYYSILGLALAAVHVVLLPTVQQIDDRTELLDIYKHFSKLALLVTPLIIIGAVSAVWFMPFVDGGKYPESILAFQLLAVSAVVSFWLSPHINLLMKMEDFKFLFLCLLFCLIVFLALNSMFIPSWGPVGAAFSNFVAYGLVNGIIYFRARTKLQEV